MAAGARYVTFWSDEMAHRLRGGLGRAELRDQAGDDLARQRRRSRHDLGERAGARDAVGPTNDGAGSPRLDGVHEVAFACPEGADTTTWTARRPRRGREGREPAVGQPQVEWGHTSARAAPASSATSHA